MRTSAISRVAPTSIATGEPFVSLFPVHASVREEIAHSMRDAGFDDAHPVVIWAERGIVIDGHTRILAAIDAGIDAIPVVHASFANEDDAVAYAIHCQRARRQHTDAELLAWIEALDQRRGRGRKKTKIEMMPAGIISTADVIDEMHSSHSEGGDTTRSADELAEKLGVSSRTVARARQVIDHADEATKAAIRRGEKTIRAAATELSEKRRRTCRKCGAALRANARGEYCGYCLGVKTLAASPAEARSTRSTKNTITVEPLPEALSDADGVMRGGKCPFCGSAAPILNNPQLVARLLIKHFSPAQLEAIQIEIEKTIP